jgi:hypothetical protein
MQNEHENNRAAPRAGGVEEDGSLGDPIRVFRAHLATRAIVAVCGIIMAGAGVFLIVRDFSDGVFIHSIGWIPLPVGLGALALAYFMGKSSYLVCTGGVKKLRMGRLQQCRWDEASEIVDMHIKKGVVSSRHCALVKKNGSRMELPDLGIVDFATMVDLIRQQAASRGIPWMEEHVAK